MSASVNTSEDASPGNLIKEELTLLNGNEIRLLPAVVNNFVSSLKELNARLYKVKRKLLTEKNSLSLITRFMNLKLIIKI